MTLEPLAPEDAVEQYLASREHDCAESTVRDHRYRLKQFLVWADETGLDDMNDLTGRDCEKFKNWRMTECDINRVTLEQHLRTFRVFIRWCESVDAVAEGTSDKILIPRLSKGEKTKEVHIEAERAEKIIDYLCRFEWATSRLFSLCLRQTRGGSRSYGVLVRLTSDPHTPPRVRLIRGPADADTDCLGTSPEYTGQEIY